MLVSNLTANSSLCLLHQPPQSLALLLNLLFFNTYLFSRHCFSPGFICKGSVVPETSSLLCSSFKYPFFFSSVPVFESTWKLKMSGDNYFVWLAYIYSRVTHIFKFLGCFHCCGSFHHSLYFLALLVAMPSAVYCSVPWLLQLLCSSD